MEGPSITEARNWKGYLTEVADRLDNKAKKAYADLDNLLSSMDASDPQQVARLQVAVSAYLLFQNTQSKLVESFVQSDRQTINRIA